MYTLTELHPSSTLGYRHVYQLTLPHLTVNDTGAYSCEIELEKDVTFYLANTTINVYSFEAKMKGDNLVAAYGTAQTLACTAQHHKVTEDSRVKLAWYKSGSYVSESVEFNPDQEVSLDLDLDGTWSDSASYRCLVYYTFPFIKPMFSDPIDVAFIGVYRSSMYLYNTNPPMDQGSAEMLLLTKTSTTDLPLFCYVQTTKQSALETARIRFILDPNVEVNSYHMFPLSGISAVPDNSPFETASRWKVTGELQTLASIIGKTVTVTCEITFSDEQARSCVFVVKTVETSDLYTKSWPSDYMTSYIDVNPFLEKSKVVWNTAIDDTTQGHAYKIDTNYNAAGVLSTTGSTKFANWANIDGNLLNIGSPDKQVVGTETQMTLSSTYSNTAVYVSLTSYLNNFITTAVISPKTDTLTADYYASPSWVAYMPTIQTSNGTKMYTTVGSSVTLTCSVYTGIVQVAWFKGSQQLDTGVTSYYKLEDKMTHTRLVLNVVDRTAEDTYSCKAGLVSQTADPWPVKRDFAVFVMGATLKAAYAPLGNAVTLTCSLASAMTPDLVIWYKEGQRLSGANTVTFDPSSQKVQSLYTIPSVEATDFTSYSATAYFNRSVDFKSIIY